MRSLALEALKCDKATRQEHYHRLRTLLKKGKSQAVIQELEALAEGSPVESPVWREIRYLKRHAGSRRLRYDVFRSWRLPMGSGAIKRGFPRRESPSQSHNCQTSGVRRS